MDSRRGRDTIRPTPLKKGRTMQTKNRTKTKALHFDIHGRVTIRVDAEAPAAPSCGACWPVSPRTANGRPTSWSMTGRSRCRMRVCWSTSSPTPTNSVRFNADRVQIVRDAEQWRIHGPGELLTSVVPVLDAAMVGQGAGMIHAATMAYRGHAIVLPAAGGTGKTSTAAKLMRREGWSFMGDDWAFLAEDATLARLREADVHQAAPPGNLPAPVRRCPEAPGPVTALAERRPSHHGGAPVRHPLSAPRGLLPAMVAGAPHGRRRGPRSRGEK